MCVLIKHMLYHNMECLYLESERLAFRRIKEQDFDTIFEMLSDSLVMYAWEHGFTENEAKEWIEKNIARYSSDGYSYMYVSDKASGEFIGAMGLLVENIDGQKRLGIGYILKRTAWGKGYATEGAKALMDFAFADGGEDSIVLDIRPENTASINVAKRLGFSKVSKHVKVYRGKEMPHLVYEFRKG